MFLSKHIIALSQIEEDLNFYVNGYSYVLKIEKFDKDWFVKDLRENLNKKEYLR